MSDMNDSHSLSFLCALKRNFRIMLVTTIVFGLLGGIFSSVTPHRYRAEVLLEPPTQQDLKAFILAQIPLNRSDSPEIYDALDTNNIFPRFKMELASRVSQLEFLEEVRSEIGLESTDPVDFDIQSADGFSKKTQFRYFTELTSRWRLKKERLIHFPDLGIGDPSVTFRVESDHTASRPYLMLVVEWNDPAATAELANQYVRFAMKRTSDEIANLLRSGLEIRAENISDMIRYQRTNADRTLADHELKLLEAIKIARQLGLEGPTDAFGNFNVINITPPPQFFLHPKDTPGKYHPSQGQKYLPLYHPGNIAKSESLGKSLTYSPPLYTRGWKALELEYESLTNRNSSDFFIPNLRDLQGQYEWIKSIPLQDLSVTVASVAQHSLWAYRTFPTRSLPRITVFVVVGLVFGIFLALLRSVRETQG